MTEKTATALRDGDVVRYEPDRTWCRDGVARVYGQDDGTVRMYDTYWYGTDSSSAVPEGSPVEVLFNVHDYQQVPQRDWERYAKADRQVIRAHSGYQPEFYVRKGASESTAQVVANARRELEEARDALRLASNWVESRERNLAAAEAAAR